MHISKLTTNSDLQNLILDIAKKLRTEISQDEAEFIIKQKPFYPMLKNNLYDPLKSILKSIAFDLTVAGDIRNSMRDLLFNNELETKIDLYIQFLAEYFIDDVLGRKVGSPESQNLNEKLKPVSTSNFRSFYHRVVYIKSYKMLQMFKDSHFETTPESDGVLVYGYIDQTAGLSFKGLCCANIDPNGEIQLCSSNTETSLTIRAGLFDDALFLDMLENNADLFEFTDTIAQTMNCYDVEDRQIELLRSLKLLDQFRHPYYPDDLYINLLNHSGESEKVWIRYTSYFKDDENTFISGELLNQPHRDFGCNLGDTIACSYYGDDDTPFLAYIKS